jgi:hypothetical protein
MPELQIAVGPALDLVTLLVDRAMMPVALCRPPDYAAFGWDREGEGNREVGIIRS